LLEAVSRFRFGWEDKMFQVGVSIGLVEVTPFCDGLAAVMSAADAACYSAKDGGRNRIHVHSGGVEDEGKRGEMQWVSRIHKALVENRFRLFRQNIIPVGASEAYGHAEVLLRMLDEDGNIVPPMAFIPAAERYNIMSQLDRWVLKNVLGWMALHPEGEDGRPLSLPINLSGQSLGDSRFLDYVIEQFEQVSVAFDRVCFEVTETAAIAHLGQAKKFIATLHERGSSFALDDFGSGMSSYAYLKNLNVDYLKIDGAFVRDMVSDPVDFAMVESINRIGHVMGIKTIAEFVEDEEILARLRELGVDYAQGYGVHKPEPL
jgi:EAL domain-containing protein (putative c-di-GMP-specific phosphodiesterase class I)